LVKISAVAVAVLFRIFPGVLKLTRQEQMVLSVVLGLLLVGWAVKAWRLANPDVPPRGGSALEQHAND